MTTAATATVRPLADVLADHLAEVNARRLKRGTTAMTRTIGDVPAEPVKIIRAEYLNHPAYIGLDGPVPARRERWLHVEFADGGRLLAHPSNLVADPA